MLPGLPFASILQLTVPGDVGKNSPPNFEDGDGDFSSTDEESEQMAAADLEVSETFLYPSDS